MQSKEEKYFFIAKKSFFVYIKILFDKKMLLFTSQLSCWSSTYHRLLRIFEGHTATTRIKFYKKNTVLYGKNIRKRKKRNRVEDDE